MLVIGLGFGVAQDPLESVMAPAEYARLLVEQGGLLRVVFALDDLFLLSYCSFFVAYYVERRGKTEALALKLLLAGVLAAGLLDAVENFHIRAMLTAAEQGRVPSAAEIELQYLLSAVKFTIGYFAAICYGLGYPRHRALARVVAIATGVGFPLVGVLVFAVPAPWSHLLALVRVLFFVSGYALSALVFWPRARTSSDAAHDHDPTRLAREASGDGARPAPAPG
jgi:hypothetical protein